MNERYFGFVYETTNLVNGKKYIGKCEFGRKNGWENYLGSGLYLKRAVKKYGENNFSREILFLALDEVELMEIEECVIKISNAVVDANYYNIAHTSRGGNVIRNHPERDQILKRRSEDRKGKGNHQYGKQKTKRMLESVKISNSREIEVDSVVYKSIRECSKAIGIKQTTIGYRLDSSNHPTYKRLVPKNIVSHSKHREPVSIEVDDIIYESSRQYSEKHGIPYSTVIKRLNWDKYPNYKKID